MSKAAARLDLRGRTSHPDRRELYDATPSWPCMAPVSPTPIQPAMARPISSGESSWRKWTPATVTSACDGHPRTKSVLRVAGEDRTGLGLHEQLGHTARRQPVRVVGGRDRSHVGGLALDGDFRGHVSVGRRPSPGSANGRRYSAISSTERVRRTAFGSTCSMKRLSRRIIASPASERSACKTGRNLILSQWSQACGRTIASMYAIPFTASRWRLAQSKPRPAQSWTTR